MVELAYTPLDEIDTIHSELRAGFRSGKLKSVEYRKYQILQLAYLVKDHHKRFEEALKSDLNRPVLESNFLEINPCYTECMDAYKNVGKWAKPEKPAFSFNFFPMKPTIHKEGKGTALIIAPFNYPLWLLVSPLVGALAAGCTACVKPAESAPAVSGLLAELIPQYLDKDVVRLVNGAIPEATKARTSLPSHNALALLSLQWDHVFYTGGPRVAKVVAAAAAKFLTPVTLELGGKSPVIIDPDCDLQTATKRILWGKVVNAGQTCVAPDYILVPRSFQDKFVAALKETYDSFYPDTAKPDADGAFSRIITPQAYSRIKGLLDNTKGEVVCGGHVDEKTKMIAPTIVRNVNGDDSLMSEEIFGPVLPIVAVEDLDEAIAFVNARDHPLALYVFTNNNAFKTKVLQSTLSGGFAANEVVILPGAEGLPFGGVGPSGYGYHTGKYGFDTFTHLRAALDSPSWLDRILSFRYPPYTAAKLKQSAKLSPGSLPSRMTRPPTVALNGTARKWWGKWFFLAFIIAGAAALTKRTQTLKSSA